MENLTKSQKNILGLYGLFGAGAVMMMTPYGIIPFAGLACVLVVFFAAYFYRWRKNNNNDFKFHMTHIIRTSWLSQLVLLIGIILFGTIIYSNGDMTSINALMDMAERGIVPNENDISIMQLKFTEENKNLILMSGAVCLLPYPLYLFYRIVKGVRLLLKKEG